MKKQRRKHTVEFKARVALEAIRGIKTLSEIAPEFEIPPVTAKHDFMKRVVSFRVGKTYEVAERYFLINYLVVNEDGLRSE